MFLPDRFIRGTCPKCGTEDQYGDSCESCGSTYSPTESGQSALGGFRKQARAQGIRALFCPPLRFRAAAERMDGIRSALQPEIANKMQEWFTDGLRDWDISRDAPYFGFKIPGTEDKYFLCLGGRTGWLHRQFQGIVRARRPGFRCLVGCPIPRPRYTTLLARILSISIHFSGPPC